MKTKIKAIIVAILGIFLTLALTGCKNTKYTEAMSLYANEDWEQAIEIFTELGDYEDSQNMVLKCYYYKAKELAENGDYENAIDIFTELGNYEDSQDMAKECLYNQAICLIGKKDYQGAINIYSKLGDYKDSVQKIDDLHVMQVDEQLQGVWELVQTFGALSAKQTVQFNSGRYSATVTVMGGKLSNQGAYRIAFKEKAIYVLYDKEYQLYADGTVAKENTEEKKVFTYELENGRLTLIELTSGKQMTFIG